MDPYNIQVKDSTFSNVLNILGPGVSKFLQQNFQKKNFGKKIVEIISMWILNELSSVDRQSGSRQ